MAAEYMQDWPQPLEDFLEDNPFKLSVLEIPLPDSSLKYEYAILTCEHLPVASRVFRWFRSAISHCNNQNGIELVNEMIQVYGQFKDAFSSQIKFYILFEGFLKVCYRLQIEDSQLIKQVLDWWYEEWIHSEEPHHFAEILHPSLSDRRRKYRNAAQPDSMIFYLEHARRLKLEYNGTRIFDVTMTPHTTMVPVSTAVDSLCWRALLRLLQFGARIEENVIDRRGNGQINWIHILIIDLWEVIIASATQYTNPEMIEEYRDYIRQEDLCHTIEIILRAVKYLPRHVMDFSLPNPEDEQELVRCSKFFNHPEVRSLIPTLSRRCGCPVNLQHACRYAIRQRLNENWQLPYGIDQLPLPRKLKRYINLLTDETEIFKRFFKD